MAKTKKENLKDMKGDELKKKLLELEEQIRILRFKAEGSKSKNVKQVGSLKKQIARVLTQINTSHKQTSKKNK
jgi:ribosomal protein L29